ncbi:MAG: NUDIX domain-containing protein, partial [Deltaproteobacteria bacterium]|nr:NUDIX domain-containing protein [Deltaproteobacteria bacterium]
MTPLSSRRDNEPAKDQWFTPGGRILRGETIHQAVKRVLHKETGLTPNKITRTGVMEHIWPDTHTVTILHMVDVTDNKVTMNDEHSDY